MADPAILIVDDELQVRNAVERDLRQKYGADYRIIKAGSGAEALDGRSATQGTQRSRGLVPRGPAHARYEWD